jgi:hypothetical protein
VVRHNHDLPQTLEGAIGRIACLGDDLIAFLRPRDRARFLAELHALTTSWRREVPS